MQILATIVLFSTGYGCTKNTNLPINTDNCRMLTIDLSSEGMNIKSSLTNAEMMENHMDSCTLIQLETRPECLIGEIYKIFFYKNRLYILDRSVSKSVFVFDLNGKWISTIARVGHGPGEYINITDMFIDPLRETLNLVAFANRKIMSFSLDGKELLSETKHRYPILSMEVSKTGTIVGNSKDMPLDKHALSTLITFQDPTLSKPSYMALPILQGWNISIGGESLLSNCDGNIYYRQAIQNQIYKIDTDSIYLAYKFDFKSRNPDPNLTQEQYENFSLQQKANTIFRIVRFSECKEGIIAEVVFGGSAKWIFITENFSKIEVIRANKNPFMKSIGFGLDISLSDRSIITQLSTKSVTRYLEKEDLPERTLFLKKYIRNPIKEDDNPILCVYHLK